MTDDGTDGGTGGGQGGATSSATPRPAWVLLAVVILIVALIRWHRIDLPLERDEGEYAYAGKLILQGHPPYSAAYNMKLPGIYVAYAVVMAVFGLSTAGIHLGLLVANAVSIVLIQRIGRRLFRGSGETAGLAAAALFAVLSLHPAFEGLCANAEHFVLPAALGGFLALLRARESGALRGYLLAGVLTGAGFVVKQHGAAFVAAAGVIVALDTLREAPGVRLRLLLARGGVLALGAALPFAAICAWMGAAGVFGSFWFWTFTYASEYAAIVPMDQGRQLLAIQVAAMGGGLLGVWALVLGGIGAVAALPMFRAARLPTFVLLAVSVAAVCPGLYFRNHYFQLLLPVASLLAGAAVSALAARLRARLGDGAACAAAAVVIAASIAAVAPKWPVFVTKSDAEVSRALFGPNPFPESVEIVRWIRANTKPADAIAVVGSEPQIYFHAGRPVATAHIYTYALMEPQPFAIEMQREMIRQIETVKPEIVVFVGVATSWLPRENSTQDILRWAEQYVATDYEQVGLVDIHGDHTTYRWGADAAGAGAASENWLGVYRRRAR